MKKIYKLIDSDALFFLNSKIRNRAIKNYHIYVKTYDFEDFEISLNDILCSRVTNLFNFSASKEGRKFWSKVNNSLLSGAYRKVYINERNI